MEFRTRLLSPLAKVFPDEELSAPAYRQDSALRGELFSFQAACYSDVMLHNMRVGIDSSLKFQLRTVGLAPVEYLAPGFDADLLRRTPGMYPDPLLPTDGIIKVVPWQWQAFWFSVAIPEDCPGGEYPVKISFAWQDEQGSRFEFVETFNLTVIPVRLPEQRLIHTQWFHVDCLATYYQTTVWSEKHWELIGVYMRNAVNHGINMILTPLFTPPLDTAVGGERPTAQLIDVSIEGKIYRFGFDRLQRWVDTAFAAGVKYFEMSHLFTQWGAAHAPKIIAIKNGVEQRVFGWDTDAGSTEYREFLDAFLPELVKWLKDRKLEGQVFFHVSDEPSAAHLDAYASAAGIIRKHLDGFPVVDALSKTDFHRHGLIRQPIPASNHLDEFVESGIDVKWTYYCCSQWQEVSNRFMHMPSSRNRVMGLLLYRYDLQGFLHWGFNFWYSQYSKCPIDPWRCVDAGHAFPPGDAFLVYPGADGEPIDSIRHEVFHAALQDLRAMRLLEEKIGRENLIAILENDFGKSITMKDYPRGEQNILAIREKINKLIAIECGK